MLRSLLWMTQCRSKVELPRCLSLGMPISFLIMDISNNRMSATIKKMRIIAKHKSQLVL